MKDAVVKFNCGESLIKCQRRILESPWLFVLLRVIATTWRVSHAQERGGLMRPTLRIFPEIDDCHRAYLQHQHPHWPRSHSGDPHWWWSTTLILPQCLAIIQRVQSQSQEPPSYCCCWIMFIKPSVGVPRILSFSSQRPDIGNIRNNYFMRNNRNAGGGAQENNNNSNQQQSSININNTNQSNKDEESVDVCGPLLSLVPCGWLCGVFKLCSCVSVKFVKTPVGIIKLTQFILCCIIQKILSDHSEKYAPQLGVGFTVLSLVNTYTIINTFILLISYSFSQDTFNRIRPSLLVSIIKD